MDAPVYLDHNATTPVLPEVVDAMLPWLRDGFGNPSSGHAYGRRAASAVATAREQVAALIGARADEIVFTSGGTEASNLAIRGLRPRDPARDPLVTSVVEHPATARPLAVLEAAGARVTRLPVDVRGVVVPDGEFSARTALLTVMHANNETGVLQPIAELAAQAHAVGAHVHTDAAQSLGKVRVNVEDLGVDLLTIAGHKLYAPKGVGALYVRTSTPLQPILFGAGHERGLRPGTENVPYLVGLGVACARAAADLDAEAARVGALRDRLWGLLHADLPDLVRHGAGADVLPNTLSLRVPGQLGAAILDACPEIAASTGSACHEGDWTASAVITAMGVPEHDALGTLRLTLGRGTSEAAVDRAAHALVRAITGLRDAPDPSPAPR